MTDGFSNLALTSKLSCSISNVGGRLLGSLWDFPADIGHRTSASLHYVVPKQTCIAPTKLSANLIAGYMHSIVTEC